MNRNYGGWDSNDPGPSQKSRRGLILERTRKRQGAMLCSGNRMYAMELFVSCVLARNHFVSSNMLSWKRTN